MLINIFSLPQINTNIKKKKFSVDLQETELGVNARISAASQESKKYSHNFEKPV